MDAGVLSKYFASGGHDSLGGRNLTKARYVEYTDALSRRKKPGRSAYGYPWASDSGTGWRENTRCV